MGGRTMRVRHPIGGRVIPAPDVFSISSARGELETHEGDRWPLTDAGADRRACLAAGRQEQGDSADVGIWGGTGWFGSGPLQQPHRPKEIQMICNHKAVGAAVLVALALSALGASAASAANFTASSYPTAATATSPKGNDDFKTEGGSWECKVHYAIAALTGSSQTATVTPTYTECQSFGFLSATVTMNGCDYVYHSDGGMDIECPAGQAMTVVSSTCEVKFGTQTGLKSIAFNNSGTGFTAKANVGGIAYTVTKDGFLCPFGGTGAKTGGGFSQNAAILFSSTNGATIDIG
jgi:hypothetical protein